MVLVQIGRSWDADRPSSQKRNVEVTIEILTCNRTEVIIIGVEHISECPIQIITFDINKSSNALVDSAN